jgi:hypothetical protein
MEVTQNKELASIPPKPLTCRVENGDVGRSGQATYDYDELKRFVEETSVPSFVVEDENGNVVGIAHTQFIRELFSEQEEGTSPILLLDAHHHQHPASPNV